MEIITGYTGKPHVTSEQDRDVNIGVVGEGSYVLRTGMQLAAEVSSNNEIKIRDGVLMHQGCTASIKKNTYDSLTITNGSQGMKRVDLIVARYEKNQDNGIESLDLKVIQGTPAESNPAAPQYTEGDIQAGDYVADMPMYQVIIEGLNITEVKKMFKVIGSNKDLSNKVAELNKNITSVKSVNKNITKMIGGSKIVTAKASTSVQVFTNSEINAALGVNDSNNENTIVSMANGDASVQPAHVGSSYSKGAWNAVFDRNAYAGSFRINYVIFYFGK
ncbi:hypothetical protein NCY30_09215 [Dorea sp. MB18-49]|uniref:hypothetical protein n=1 Tax=Dorea sp. MB18-49 TaxID=2949745 RepID=UPI00202F3127|nr:hypothetical protein [Dorea sp. MB18-49]MCM1894953.1 hypothetical protein [Dorea sp. MB18-49]